MLRYNRDKISKLIFEMRKALDRLDSIGKIKKEEFLNDPDKIDSAKYNFIVAIESAIDICNHIISQNGFRPPQDYADTFKVLAEQGILEDDFVNNLRNMVKFRNRLVHIYWEIDNEQIYLILKNNIKDLKRLLDKIIEFIFC
ncbi:DUF86 domain-containing protein [Dictyoglomus thermophilum]|uniref:type VII toxin-antitoxin system HepT family RNase toxin n=1 Tax=Dictyoglomus thermophilum TaxID=14 RepID=UPI0011EB4411|nr:DUF86 domain-containing protein [Dictyoglomus thermophilum]TYT20333.1 DUF86 domain-containing protein [Dictyoglomus thermophilum]